MKILLIFTFFLVSDLEVVGFNVTGYQRGSVIIYYKYQQHKGNNKYFCKESTNQCVYLKPEQTQNTWDYRDRVYLHDHPEKMNLRLTYRKLSLEDAGSYQYGETGVWNNTVNLTVKSDPSWGGTKTVVGYLGGTVNIHCAYAEGFEKSDKYFYKLESQHFNKLIDTSESEKGRLILIDHRTSKVAQLKISNVREDDGGVYSCGVKPEGNEVNYYSLFAEIQLRVNGRRSSTVTICLSICVVLLLIGGLTLIFYKLRCSRTEGSAHIIQTPGTIKTINYESNPTGMQENISMSPFTPNLDSTSNHSDSIYQNLDSITIQSDSVYQSLDPNTYQSNSVYQSLDPNAIQSDSVYQSLDPNTYQSDSVY